MNEPESPVGGESTADPLLSPSGAPEPIAASFPAADPAGNESPAGASPAGDPPAAEPDVEVVDGLPVVAEVRTIEQTLPAGLPTVQVAAVAATGFVAGAATVALVKRRAARKMARAGRGGSRRAVDLLPIAATRSFLVDVHVIAKPE